MKCYDSSSHQESHRPGPLKQQNKSHKHGKHKSKGHLERDVKGRVNVKSLSKKSKLIKNKNDRRNQAQQLRKYKREEVLARKRSRGMAGTPPHCVAVISLHSAIDSRSAVRILVGADDTATAVHNEQNITHLSIPRFKQRVEFVCAGYGRLYEALDAVKVADSVLLLLSTAGGADQYGRDCLSCLLGHGLPAVTLALVGLADIAKKQNDVKKQIQKDMENWFPQDKLHTLDTTQDGLLVLRHITSQKLKTVHYRENRPHMLAEHIKFTLQDSSEVGGTLELTGFLRGQTLSVNRLVHLPGWGDFQLSQADVLDDPYPLHPRSGRQRSNHTDVEMVTGGDGEEPVAVVTERPVPSQQESLQAEVEPDPMAGEQTWPTADELSEAHSGQGKKVRKVPRGTSEYQAAWIIDSEDDSQDDSDGSDEEMDEAAFDAATQSDCSMDSDGHDVGEDEYEDITVADGNDDATKYDKQIDMDEDRELLRKLKEEKLHVMFPDEVDTPLDSTAHTRFQKYRGLQSFRTSNWDKNENLPLDYARIYQFDNFRHTAKRVLASYDDMEGGIAAWSYVRIHIANVPKAFMESYMPGSPVVVFGLLPHEQKMSVVNFVVRKCAEITRPIKSKERLVFHVGFRRFSACPVFSQHTNGNKHKCERFLPSDMPTVATMFAPVTFPPMSVLVFQDRAFGGQELVAKGTMMSVAPDRIITKRAVLSGYPFKINKRSCVVRYMFFNREDINWFKPVELRTKWGRRGHIKEPLGTHGHMKCVFDGQLKSQDCILMNLYKRVFPKWTYSPLVSSPAGVTVNKRVTMDTIEEEDKEGAAFAMFD